jgi:uncharacterized repeat protein (TIGR01451 family)
MERRAPFVLAWILFLLGTSVGQDDVVRTKGRVAPAAIQNPTRSSVAPAKNRPSVSSAQKTQALVNYSRLPLSFEPNQGQAGSPVKFLSRGSAYNLSLTDNEALLALQKQPRKNEGAGGQRSKARLEPTGQTNLRLRFEGANPAPVVSGEDELPGKSNYFIGNDPRQWRRGIPNYARVRYHQVYPGIDVVYYGNQGRLEYDFVVAPGAQPQQIGLVIEGAEKLATDAAGNLVMHIEGGAVRFEKPLVYQEFEGQRREIAGGGYLLDKGRVSFRVGDYDHRQPLIIDPVLAFSTYLGGSGDELFILSNIDGAIALDSTGDIYVAGETLSTSFAFPGFPASGYKQSCGTDGTCNSTAPGGPYSDIFIAKLNSTASTVLAFTYLGGSGRDILALTSASGGLVVDTTGVYVSGTTYSSDYPTTAGVFRPTCTIPDACTGAGDGFVTKLDVNLGSLLFSTYLSGNGTSQAGQMQVDSTGDVYVIGQAEGGYPTTTSLTPCTPVGTCLTGFVTELNNTGTGQVFSTFLGGSGQDFVDALALDSSNNVYVVGATTSTDFPGQKTLLPAATSGGIFTSTNGTTWTALNSGLAGLNVEAVAVNPATPTTLIAGTGQGIFQSTNSGTTWTLVSAVINVTSIAFDPLNPLNVYAANSGGVLKSTDGGTWVPISGSPGGSSNIAVDPNNEGTVYAGTQGQGLWKSTDGGTSWTQVQSSSGLTAGYINAIVIDPTNSANVYVGSPGQGVFASTNGGANWSQMNNGLITNSGTAPAIRALAIDPNNHTTLYAGTSQGVFKTTNSASTWTQVSTGLNQGAGTTSIKAVAVDPANSQNVYAGSGSAGLFFSSNGGASWSLLGNLGPHIINALALHAAPSLPTTVYAGTGYEFAFAAKINSGGGSLSYATLLGGNAQTYLWGIALDSSNNAYLGGQTYASNFPASATAFQKNLLGLSNGLAAKLNSSGNSLTYASYLGGSGSDTAYSIALDGNQQAWLTGSTSSQDFPLANGIWLQSPEKNGGSNEAFITQVNAGGTGLLFSTYLGGEGNCQNCNGSSNSEGVDITVDPGGNAYVIGFTNDSSFPTANALQPAPAGGYDAFVAKIGSVTTVTDLSICLLDSSGQCTSTPPAAVIAGADFPLNLQVTNKSATTSATGVVVGGRGGNGIHAIACTVSVGTCAPDNSSITIPNGGFASLGTLAPGASAQVSITLVPTQAGTFGVTLDVRENETDANPADNSASTTLTVLPGADLAVTLTAAPSPAPVQVGGTLIYIANVANLGPSNASNVIAVFSLEPTTAATFVLPLPSGCSNIVAGTLTCVLGPMPAGTAGPGTIPVTVNSLPITAGIVVSNSPEADPDPANNVASMTTTLSAAGVNNAELNGQYAFVLRGFDPSGQAIAIGGSFTADGAGNITGGVLDINDAGSTPCSPSASCPLTINAAPASFYAVGADNRGMLTLATSAGTQTFDFSVGSLSGSPAVAGLGHIISRQNTSATNGSAISGVFKKQDPTAFTLAALNGDWAFLNEGVDGSGGRFANAGRFTLSAGNITNGSEDFNDNGVFDNGTTTALTLTGSFGSVDTTNGRVPLTAGSGTTPGHTAVYIVSASEALFMSIDAISVNPLGSGSALRQSTTFCPTTGGCNFTNSALNGNAVIYTQGNSSSGVAGAADVNVGVLTFTLATTSFSGSLDENDGGTIYCPPGNICANPGGSTASGIYSVASNGRVTLALGGGENNPPFFYMVNTNQAFLIGSSSGHVNAGVAENQVGPIASGSLGNAFGNEPPAVNGSLIFSGVQTVTAVGSTTASLTSTTDDVNSVGPIPDMTRGGLHEDVSVADDALTLDPTTGRFTFASGTKVGYFINSNKRVAIDIETTTAAPYVIISDNQSSSISAEPDLAVAIAANPSTGVFVGGPITYTVTVSNARSTPATGAVLTTVLLPSLAVNSLTPSQGSCTVGASPVASFTCSLGTVSQGTPVTITIVAVAPASGIACGSSALGCIIVGTDVTENEIDFNPADNGATATTPMLQAGATSCTGATTNWIGATGNGGPGNWSVAANWSTGVVPNSSSVNVCIDNGNPVASAVTLDISATVGNLYIDSNDSLTISNNTALVVSGSISNSGQISVSAAGNTTFLQIAGGQNVSLTGGGTLTLSTSGNGTPIINQTSGGATLTNVNNTIQGQGQIGNNGLALVNQAGATINANAAAPLLINSSGITNAGLLEATGAGTLQISTTVNNTGGTLAARGSSTVQFLTGTSIQGGTLNASGGATLGAASGHTITLDGSTHGALTNAGTYTGINNSATIVQGTINNTGAIQIAAVGNTTLLQVAGGQNTSLAGGGTVTLSKGGNGTAVFNETSGGATLTNVDNTIQGQGEIGNNGLVLVNQAAGTINANAAGTLTLDAPSITNQHVMEATSGGTLAVNSTTVNNNAGTILANGGTVQFTSTTIQGGTLNTLNNGVLGTASGQTATLDGLSTHQGTVSNIGTYTAPDSSATILQGTINNAGAILLAAAGNVTELQILGGQTTSLTGAGTLTMSTTGNGTPIILQTSGSGILSNADNTIQGQGEIGNNGLALVNSGTIDANVLGKTLTIDAVTPTNAGTLEATAGGILALSASTINNKSGIIKADAAGSTVQFVNNVTLQSGTLAATNGGLLGTAAGNAATLDGSTLGQQITLSGAYTAANSSATILVGTINNTGSFLLSAAGNVTELQVRGGQTVTLTGGGTVTMSTSGNGTPIINQTSGGGGLTNVNNIIAGQGEIGNNGLTLVNQATINANVAGGILTIDAVTPTNTGILEATSGGTLALSNDVINNQGGTITVDGASSAMQFVNSATIQGGTLATTNGGVLGAAASATITLDGSTHGTLNNTGTFVGANNSATILFGTINNTGAIQINATGNVTELQIRGGQNVILTGAGTVTMSKSGNGTPIINQTSGGSTLTNVNNTIQGQGEIGSNGLALVNQATINANVPGGTLTLDPVTLINAGTVQATNSGAVSVITSTVNNQAGAIKVDGAASAVQFVNGAVIQGGTLVTTNGGVLGTAASTTITLDGSSHGALTNAGTYTAANNSATILSGTINNGGVIQIAATGNITELQVSGGQNVLLTGGGTVTMSSSGNGTPIIDQTSGGSTLTNVNNLIQGQGQIGVNGMALVNQAGGTINANAAGALLINASTVTNQHLLEATGGGTLQINTTVSSPGGAIAATGAGSAVQFSNGAIIQGGTLSTSGGAVMGTVASNTVTLDGSTGSGPVNNTGTYAGANNSATILNGTINNTGAIQIAATGNITELQILGGQNVTLTGSGAVTMSTSGNGTPIINQTSGGTTLTNAGNTIQGQGVIGNNGLSVINQGTITANLSGVGAYSQTAGATVIPAATNASVASFAISGGTAQVDGTLSSPGGVSVTGTGTLFGTGIIIGNLGAAGVIRPGDSPGILTISGGGTYTQSSTGALDILIGGTTLGTQFSQLNVVGPASLGGSLNVSLANGFNPAVGNSFTILTSTAISGTFATVNLPPLSSGSWQVTYNATTVVLTVSALSAPGTLYSTGFENPPFTLGNLSGQDGWQVSSVCGLTGPTTGLVENTLVQSGSQAVSVDGSVTCQSGPYHSDSSTGPLVELSAGIYIASSSNQTQWQFAGLGPGLAPFIGGVGILGTGQIVAITAGLPTVGTWTYNAWNNLDFLFNFSTQTYAITLNGVPLASGLPFCGDNGPCAGAAVTTYGTSLFDTFGGGNDTGYIDNFSLTNPILAISSISPTSATAGGGAFTLTVNGGGFVSGATVSFNGNARTTTFVSAAQLTAAILAADIATAGTFNVVVANPAAGGTSNAVSFTVNNPVPVIATIAPTSATAGDGGFTLTVNGAPATATGNMTVQSTDVIYAAGSQSSLAAGAAGTVPGAISLSPLAGSVSFSSVRGSLTSACASAEGCISVNIGTGSNQNDPDGTGAATATSSNTGSGSISGMTGPGAGYLVGVFVAAGGPSGTAPPALDFTSSGIGTSFTTLSPLLNQVFFIGDGLTGDGTGTVQTFNVPAGAAQLYLGISDAGFYNGAPGAYNDNSGSYSVTYNVANATSVDFVAGSTVNFNGIARTTTFVSAMQLTAAILASDIATAGNDNVTVTSPGPGGGTSAPAVFVVSAANPAPTITTISPTSAVAGGAGFTLTVNGTGFVATSAVNFGADAPVTTFVSPTQLTAAIPAGDIATAGNVNVTVTSPGPGGGTSNTVTFTVGNVAATADLAVAITASPSPAPVLGSVTYQITVTNNGPNPTTGVVLTDALPTGTVFASIDDLTDCVVSNGTLTCNYSALGAGNTQTVNLILVPLVVPSGAGTFNNTVSVAANETDPNLANNSATQTVQVTGTTLPGGGAFRNLPGFSNNILPGNDDDSTGSVPMNLTLNFFGVQVSSVFVNNNGNVTFDSALGTFTPFPLTSTNQQIIAPYFSDVETDFPTSGLVTYGNDTVNGRPAFGVNWPNVEYFGEGPATLLDLFQVILVDRSDVGSGDFDIEFNYDQIQWETGDASGGTGGLGGSSARVGYSNGSQTAGSFFELPGSGVPGSFLDTNTTTGLIYNDLNSTQPGRYLFQVRGGTVQSSADLAISANGPQAAATGSTITYTLTATNLGPNTATGVTVTDTLPAGFTFVSATPSNICSPAGQPVVVTCNVGSLANGSNAIITIQAGIPTTASGTATDTAVVSVPNNQDLNLGNNTATVLTNIAVLNPDLTIIKTHNDPFAQGQTGATYTITVTNSGTGATTGTVTVNDTLPIGLTATAISGTGDSNWVCTLQPLSCTRSDSLAAGASYDAITLTVTVAANATLGQVTNTATVSGGGEVNTANDTANDVTNIVAAAAALVPTVAVIPPPDATGTTISYTVTITNNGPSAATSVTLTDQLTGNAGFVSASSDTMTCPAPSATSLNCTLAVLNNGASVTVTITVNLTGAGWDLNAIGVTSPVPNPNPSNHTLTVQRLAPGGNTVTGSDVAVQPMDSASGASPAVLTFADVTRGGTTTLASAASGPAPPAGFRAGTPAVFYNLATTAGYAGTIGVALGFNAATFHHPAKVRLFHSENGGWVDRTVAINPAVAYAVARVTSLSPFALFEPINHVPEAKAGLDLSTVATSAQGAKVTLNGSASFDADNDPLTYRWMGPFPEGNGVATGVNPTVTMPPGGNSVTLVVNDGEANSAPAIQNIIVTDFSMAAVAAGPTTISAGASVGFSVTASPQFGPFPPAIALACLGLPQGAQCNFSTTSVNAGGAAATLTITTAPRTAAALAPLRHRNPAPLYTLWMPLPAIALMGLGLRRRSRKRAAALMLLLLLGMMLLLVSCGGGSMGTTPPPQNGTPVGTFTVTVVGTANGSLQHTTTATFTVQ